MDYLFNGIKMKMIKALLLFSLVVLSSCSKESLYEIKDADVKLASIQQLYWINEREVLYWNFDENNDKYAYIWDTESNTTRKYAKVKNGLCYSDGYIHYFVRHPSGEKYEMQGKFGKESLEKVNRFYLPKDKKIRHVRNRYTCKWDYVIEEHKDKRIHYLKEEHGYLLTGTAKNNDENIKYVTKDGEMVTLPMIRLEYRSPKGFFDFKKAYFFWAVRGASSTWGNRCQKAWWLYLDGNMESMCVPLVDGVSNGSVLVYPYKDGYLFFSHGRGGRQDSGNAGVYLLNQKMELAHKLLSGHADGVAISPDGCNVAFRLNPIVNKNIRLTSMNLCGQ